MHLFEVMTWLDFVELVGYLCLPSFLIADMVWRDRVFQTPKFWRGRAALVTVVAFYGSIYVAQFWGRIFEGVSLLNATVLGTVGGAAVGILAYQLVHYGYQVFMWRGSFPALLTDG